MTTGKPPFTGPAGILNPTADGKVAVIPPEDVDMLPPHTTVDSADKVAPPVRVAILSPFQVVHERRAYLPGDTVEVPQHVAQRWLRNRWVTTVDQQSTDDESAPAARRGRK